MSGSFCNKYRSESHRFPGWNYAGNGMYYLTLVTQDRDCNLGHIADAKMYLSDFGEIVNTEWLKSFDIREELILDEYQIMPNHIHAIVKISKRGNWPVDTHGRAYLQDIDGRAYLQRLPKSISSFIGGFKAGVNSKIDDFIDEKHLRIPKYNKNNHFFQHNYHDHVIRNREEYLKIKNYIIQNPKNWDKDEFNNPQDD
ncbi:transposase [Marinilabilia rubra]|uniref:Transposase IS200-like domain-containing protein n=1 Tax=Marinilabilia rubra TaxID=2162893 RepID=A0A2U2B5C8_9BACT|nr:transposase [Marinilabilia rubra]PWD98242.1 hypothetical protein DDZ16_16545 [Marinilabilia rubra]